MEEQSCVLLENGRRISISMSLIYEENLTLTPDRA